MDFLAPAIPEGMSVLQPLLLNSCHVGTGHLLLYRRNGMGIWAWSSGSAGGSLFEGCQMTRRDLGLNKPCCCHSSWPISLQRNCTAMAKKQKGRLKKSRGCNVSLQAWVFFLHNGVSEIISISSLNYRVLQLHLYKAHVLTVHPWKHFPAVGFTLHMHIENGIPVVPSAILRAGCSSMELVNSGVVF